jgi:LacI family transcriptional regulator
MPNATVFDVASLAGVSIKTVSRVVNSEPHVRPSTKARVDRAITELDYHPDESAQILARQRTRRNR